LGSHRKNERDIGRSDNGNGGVLYDLENDKEKGEVNNF
jgi:hypothetical protein